MDKKVDIPITTSSSNELNPNTKSVNIPDNLHSTNNIPPISVTVVTPTNYDNVNTNITDIIDVNSTNYNNGGNNVKRRDKENSEYNDTISMINNDNNSNNNTSVNVRNNDSIGNNYKIENQTRTTSAVDIPLRSHNVIDNNDPKITNPHHQHNIQSDESNSTGSGDGGKRHQVEKALGFLELVRKKYSNELHIYTKFLTLMRSFKTCKMTEENISSKEVIDKVKNLFNDNCELFEHFSEFVIGDKNVENMAGLINAANNLSSSNSHGDSESNAPEDSSTTDKIETNPAIMSTSSGGTSSRTKHKFESSSHNREFEINSNNPPQKDVNMLRVQQPNEHNVTTNPTPNHNRVAISIPNQNIRVALALPNAMHRPIYPHTNPDGIPINNNTNCMNGNVIRPAFPQHGPPMIPQPGPSPSYRNFSNFPVVTTSLPPVSQYIPRRPTANNNPGRDMYHQFRNIAPATANASNIATNRRFQAPGPNYNVIQSAIYHNIAPNTSLTNEIKPSKNPYPYVHNPSNKSSSSGSDSASTIPVSSIASTSPSNTNITNGHPIPHSSRIPQQAMYCTKTNNQNNMTPTMVNQNFIQESADLYNNNPYGNIVEFQNSFDRGAFDFVSTVKMYFTDVLKKPNGYQEFVRSLREYQVQHEMCEMSTLFSVEDKRSKENELLKKLMDNVSSLFNHNAELINSFLHYLPSLNNSLTSTNLAPYHASTSITSKPYPTLNMHATTVPQDPNNITTISHQHVNQRTRYTPTIHARTATDNDTRSQVNTVINPNKYLSSNASSSSLPTTFSHANNPQPRPFTYQNNKIGSIPPTMASHTHITHNRVRTPYNKSSIANYSHTFDAGFIFQIFTEIKAVTNVKDYSHILKCIYLYNYNAVTFSELLCLFKYITYGNKIAYSKIRTVLKSLSNSPELESIFPEIYYPGSEIPKNRIYNRANVGYPSVRMSNARAPNTAFRNIQSLPTNKNPANNFYQVARFPAPYTTPQLPKAQRIIDSTQVVRTRPPILKKSTGKDTFLSLLSGTQHSRFYLDRSKRISSSYFLFGKSTPNWKCSGMNSLASSVINNECLSEAHSILEEKTTNTSTPTVFKNTCEEELTRVEEERFELDMLLNLVNDVSTHFKNIVESRHPTSFSSVFSNGMKFFVYKALHNLYGDWFRKVIAALRTDHLSTIKVIIPRLEQKIKEWENSKLHLEETWRKVVTKNYLKALDYQHQLFKAIDLKKLKGKQLIKEIENTSSNSSNENSSVNVNDSCIVVEYKSKQMVSHATNLVMYYAKRQSNLTSDDKGHLEKLLMHEFFSQFFDISNYTTTFDPTLTSKKRTIRLFGSDDIYVFFRLHNILCERLEEIYKICEDAFLVSETCKNENITKKTSTDLVYNYPFLLSKSTHHRFSSSRRVNSLDELFNFFIDLVQQLLDGNIDSDRFEDECRFMFGTKSYIIFTIDKIIHECVKYLNFMVFNSPSENLINLFIKYDKTIQDSIDILDSYKVEIDDVMKPYNYYYELLFNSHNSDAVVCTPGITDSESSSTSYVSIKVSLFRSYPNNKQNDVKYELSKIVSNSLASKMADCNVTVSIGAPQPPSLALSDDDTPDNGMSIPKNILNHVNFENWRSYVSYFTRSETIPSNMNATDGFLNLKSLGEELRFIRDRNVFLVRNLREGIKRLPKQASHIIEIFHNLYTNGSKINTSTLNNLEGTMENLVNHPISSSTINDPNLSRFIDNLPNSARLFNKSCIDHNCFHHSRVDEYSNGLVIFDNETYALEPIAFKMQFLRDSQYFLYNKNSSENSLIKFNSIPQSAGKILEDIIFNHIGIDRHGLS